MLNSILIDAEALPFYINLVDFKTGFVVINRSAHQ